jgi:hypothetical protein
MVSTFWPFGLIRVPIAFRYSVTKVVPKVRKNHRRYAANLEMRCSIPPPSAIRPRLGLSLGTEPAFAISRGNSGDGITFLTGHVVDVFRRLNADIALDVATLDLGNRLIASGKDVMPAQQGESNKAVCDATDTITAATAVTWRPRPALLGAGVALQLGIAAIHRRTKPQEQQHHNRKPIGR